MDADRHTLSGMADEIRSAIHNLRGGQGDVLGHLEEALAGLESITQVVAITTSKPLVLSAADLRVLSNSVEELLDTLQGGFAVKSLQAELRFETSNPEQVLHVRLVHGLTSTVSIQEETP